MRLKPARSVVGAALAANFVPDGDDSRLKPLLQTKYFAPWRENKNLNMQQQNSGFAKSDNDDAASMCRMAPLWPNIEQE